MRFALVSVFGVAAMLAACSTVSATDDEEPLALSSSGKKGNSSNSKNNEKSSSSRSLDVMDEDCEGEAGEPWDGTTAKNFACGSGTKLSPYIILTAEQLAHLSFVVNASDKAFSGKYFKLGADIVLNKGKIIDEKGGFVADSAKLHKWTPIGNSSVAFDGNFDGDGYTVSGMFINTTSTHNGLFGNSQGTVRNLTVENSWVYGGNATAGVLGNLRASGEVKNILNRTSVVGMGDCTGGVVGKYESVCCNNVGVIENVENEGFVTGLKTVGGIIGNAVNIRISKVTNLKDVVGSLGTGGIAGYLGSNSSLENALNYAKITGKEQTAGIAGYMGYWLSCGNNDKQAYLTNAKNFGAVEGTSYTAGIIGKNDCSKNLNIANDAKIVGSTYVAGLFGYSKNSSTKSAYNRGDTYGTIRVGGIVGYNEVGVSQSVYSTGKVDGDSLVGLMIGYNYNTTMADYYYLKRGKQEPFGLNNGGGVATPKTEDEMKSKDFAKLLGDEFVYDSGLNDGYPVLSWEKE